MTDFSPLSFEALAEQLQTPARTLILVHRSPDADAIGSAFALKMLLNKLGSVCYCIASDEMTERLSFLAEGQDSILEENLPTDFQPERILSIDVASSAQLGSLEKTYAEKIELMIDHHGNGSPFTNHYVLPTASASAEIVFDLAKTWQALGKLNLDTEVAIRLYAAISSDTGCFRFSNVTSKTHQIAAELLSYGIDGAEINQALFDSRTMEELKAISAGIGRLKTFFDGKVAIIDFPFELKQTLGLQDHHLETLVGYARSLKGVLIAASIRQPSEEGVFRVSTRSSCNYDVSELCAKFGGGGHKRASGCTVEAENIETAVQIFLDAIDLDELQKY